MDVRTHEEYQEAHVPHAHLLPLDELRDHLNDLDPTQETVVYCRVGLRGYLAARILLQHGFSHVSNLTGGFLSYIPTINQTHGVFWDLPEISCRNFHALFERTAWHCFQVVYTTIRTFNKN